jgi:tetratricopeptide (TPR) repeat protein
MEVFSGSSLLSQEAIAAQQVNIESLLKQIESYLLPRPQLTDRGHESNNSLPKDRLDMIILETLEADHLRTMLTMYRDNDHNDSLFNDNHNDEDRPTILGMKDYLSNRPKPSYLSEVSEPSNSRNLSASRRSTLTSEELIERNFEGRNRILALSKLCYGADSLETMRSGLDLIHAYALCGHWAAVHEQIGTLLSKYLHLQTKRMYVDNLNQKSLAAKLAAENIQCFYSVLRSHAARNRGQVRLEVLDELKKAYKEQQQAKKAAQSNTSHEDSYLDAAIGSDDEDDDDEDSDSSEVKSMIASIGKFLDHHLNGSQGKEQISKSPSWGMLVDYIRYQNPVISKWMDNLESGILPHIRGALSLAFNQGDRQHRHVSHPGQLAANILKYPISAKIIASSPSENPFLRSLSMMKTDIEIIIRASSDLQRSANDDTSRVIVVDITESTDNFDKYQLKNVGYEIPIAWEEVLSSFFLTNSDCCSQNQSNLLLRGQLLTMLGICHLFFHGNISDAEESFRQALQVFEDQGFAESILSCELYSAIAQLMISKYKLDLKNVSATCQAKVDAWIVSEEGMNKFKEECSTLHRSSTSKDGKASLVVSKLHSLIHLDANLGIKTRMMKQKLKEFMGEEENVASKSMEAAFRYLIKSYEILEAHHGPNHIVIATSCVAIASIKASVKDHSTAREWLSKALKILSKIDAFYEPNPLSPEHESSTKLSMRSIPYVQIQLAHVMFKSGYEQEGTTLLSHASSYHVQRAYQELKKLNKTSAESQFLSKPITKSSTCYEDVQLAITITNRLLQLLHKQASKHWEIIELMESLCKLIDIAFGWDSTEAAEYQKQIGVQYALVGDWMKAINHLKKSLEIYEELYGEDSKYCIHIEKLLQVGAYPSLSLLRIVHR